MREELMTRSECWDNLWLLCLSGVLNTNDVLAMLGEIRKILPEVL